MGRKLEIQPGWLVSLIKQWAIHDLRSETGGLGYASGSSWMRGLKSSPASSIDPTGYAARDFTQLESALRWLSDEHQSFCAALMMYYKPWLIAAFMAEGYPHGNSVFYDRLHRAHRLVADHMDAARQEVKKLLDLAQQLE